MKEYTSLTVRLNTKDKESLIGFSIRLAQANGLFSLKDLFSPSQINRFSKGSLSEIDYYWLRNILKKEVAYTNTQLKLFNHPLYKFNRLTNPKVCIQCLKERHIHQDHWQNIHKLKCDIHHTQLITQCHSCKAPLEWGFPLLIGRCTNTRCLQPLVEMALSIPPNISPQEIDDCLLVAQYINGRNEFNPKKSCHCEVKDFNQALLVGYKALNDKKVFQSKIIEPLITHRVNQSAYPAKIKLLKLYQIISQLQSDWPISRLLSAIYQKRLSNQKGNCECPPLVIQARLLRQTCGLTHTDLKALHQAKILKYNNYNKNNYPQTTLDISPLFQSLVSSSQSTTSSLKSLEELKPEFECYRTPMHALIIAMLQSKIRFCYHPKMDLMSSLLVDKHGLIKFCKSWLQTHDETKLSLDDFVKVFDVDDEAFRVIKMSLGINAKYHPTSLSTFKGIADSRNYIFNYQ
ncbi:MULTISPECIES: hypothetical protein [unclassified Pseudoalteromonas]|uniref:hypothetical protein n=1 Tax=unclassified Pseudoalteromonas TaxID=194690 RepID=UPI0005A79C1A|nr:MULTISPECIES: hypothetical protein [unclassified Pseudoalteromonas]